MRLSELLDLDQLRQDISCRYISVRSHPLDEDLIILNYTHTAAFDGYWTPETKICRGLIVQMDGYDGTVVGRPFRKFYNYAEHLLAHEDIPLHESFSVTEKEDGSLGIWYLDPAGEPSVATRGSFESDQAIWATNHLRACYGAYRPSPGTTALYEIVFPANRIVLDYGGMEDLIHLANIDIETGLEVPEKRWVGPRVKSHAFEKLEDLQRHVEQAPADNREGFVITFESGLKVKVKFAEYVALHRVLTGLSERRIWEHISNGGDIEDFIEGVPDEFYQWVRDVDSRLRMQHDLIIEGLKERVEFYRTKDFGSRKELAFALAKEPDRGWLFRAFDGQWDRLDREVWRAIKPMGNVTFREDDDS